MEKPRYLEIIETKIIGLDSILEEPMIVLIPVADKKEAITLLPIWKQEFITRGVAYKAYYHFHTHNISTDKNQSCIGEDI